jgi:hypothetical protein
MPTLSDSPDLSFGSTFVPSRFQISGGMVPESRSVAFDAAGDAGSGSGSGAGTAGAGVGSPGCGIAGPVLISCAFRLLSKNTLESKASSSGSTGSAYQERS